MKNYSISRRNFLKTAVAAPVGMALAPSALAQAAAAPAAQPKSNPLPTRRLGKNGPEVSMVFLGGSMPAMSTDYLDIAWSMGIRAFDTSPEYLRGKSETAFAEWFAKHPERRKEIFLVSKDKPAKGLEQMLESIDQRLAACGTTYLDGYYIHGIGPHEYGYGEGSLNWPKSDQLKKVAEQLKSSGKIKLMGFSCHDPRRIDYVNAAAEGGFLDVIMLAFDIMHPKGGPLDQALDAAHKAGIGLIAMKTMRGGVKGAPARLPEFDKLGLTTPQAVLHAAWSDPRLSAICTNLQNTDEMSSSTDAARSYKKPLKSAHMDLLKETMMAGRRTMCPGCPSCAAFARQTRFAFNDISRFVTYYEQDGNCEARDYYQAVAAEYRDPSQVDLAALRDGCQFKTDYPEIIRRAERYFA
jgi:aryl-alcohol dehydrogenase-like predicted oxidoreductase